MLPENNEILVIDIAHMWKSICQHNKKVILTTLVFAFAAGLYVFLPFQKQYRSEATLLFNSSELSNVVSTAVTVNNFLSGQSRRIDPYKNQEELLKSRKMAIRVYDLLKKEEVRVAVKTPEKLAEKVLQAKHVDETDFIKVSALASNPQDARKIAEIYVKTYLEMMEELLYAPLKEQEEVFLSQVSKAETELSELNKKIQTYQIQNDVTDITSESQLRINQLITLDRQINDTQASIAEKKAEVDQILTQLNIKHENISSVIQSVAGGQDGLLSGLQNRLYEAVKEYEIKSLTYAATNPDMKKLEEKINIIKQQIADQQMLTVGQSLGTQPLLIKDELRAEMINRLVDRDAQYKALQNKFRVMLQQNSTLKKELQNIPEKQLEYARLQLEHRNKENVLTKLQEKLAEVKIQKSAIRKKLIEVDPPSLPTKPDMPYGVNLITLAALMGFVLSSACALVYATMQPQGVSSYSVESTLKLPVFSVIPWLGEAQWKQLRTRNVLEVTTPGISSNISDAYQNLALNLKVQRDVQQKNALAVSSVFRNASQSVMLANLAYCLAQSGERVVLVDTNLREPKMHNMFGHSLNYDKGLTELINGLSEYLYRKDDAETSDILGIIDQSLIPSGIHPNLHYMNAGVSLDNTFEFLNSKGFLALAKTLKGHYDWVLFDTPPFLQCPDASVLLGCLDGLLLFVERDASETQVSMVHKRVNRLNSSIVGTVLREGVELETDPAQAG